MGLAIHFAVIDSTTLNHCLTILTTNSLEILKEK